MKRSSAMAQNGAAAPGRIVRNALLMALGALILFALPVAPAVAQSAITMADLNMRTGPSTQYPVIVVVRRGSPVQLHSCLQGNSWCHVSHRGATGWVSGRYLEIARPVVPRRGGVFPFISFRYDFDGPALHDSRGYRDYREPAYRNARGYDWRHATPPRQGGFPPRSNVRTHAVPPPVAPDYDLTPRRDIVTRDYREPQYRTGQPSMQATPLPEQAPPRRTSSIGATEMAEPRILERRRD